MSRGSIWFVTPAYRRYVLSAICFEQRRRTIEAIRAAGGEAECVIVADDANLDLAQACGFARVEQDNSGLGRKFNDGIEYAARNGAEWIVPIGSDSWLDPAYLLSPEPPKRTRTSSYYSVVTADRLAELRVTTRSGVGPYMFHRSLLEGCGFRPAQDSLRRSVDHSTIRGIGQPIPWHQRNLHPFQYVGFRGRPHITKYGTLMNKWGVAEHEDPWAILETHYPADLVARAKAELERIHV